MKVSIEYETLLHTSEVESRIKNKAISFIMNGSHCFGDWLYENEFCKHII